MTGAAVAAAWLAGVALAALLGGAAELALAPASGAAIAFALLAPRVSKRALLLAVAGLAVVSSLAALRYETGIPHPERSELARLNDADPVTLRAIVSEPPEDRGTNLRARLDVLAVAEEGAGWHAMDGSIMATLPRYPEVRYGDVLEVRGALETPPRFEDFDYRAYLARQGVASQLRRPEVTIVARDEGAWYRETLYTLREYLGERLARELPEPEAGLAQGMAFGARSAIDEGLRDDLNATGTSHLVVVSGQNLVIIAGLVISAFAWLIGQRGATILAIGVVALYMLLTGAEPPVVRGTAMAFAWALGTLFGRRSSSLVALLLAGAFMTAIEPANIDDVSFQLSFAATAGMILLANPLSELTRRRLGVVQHRGIASGVIDVLAVTLASTLATLPITAINFGRISLIALPANLLLVPLFPVVLGLSTLTAVAGGLWAPLADIPAPFAWLALTAMTRLVRLMADVPLASWQVEDIGVSGAIALYVALVILAFFLRRAVAAPIVLPSAMPGLERARAGAFALGGGVLTAICVMGALRVGQESDGRLTVSFLDVGQGDAVVLRSSEGRTVLVDGGPDPGRLLLELSEVLPPRDRSIDLVVATHPDADHATGLVEVLADYEVGELMVPEKGTGPPFAALLAEADERDVPQRIGRAGLAFEFDGATLTVVGPTGAPSGNENDRSLVLRVSYGSVDVLLTGDVEAAGEAALAEAAGPIDVLKVAHHGSKTSSTSEFLLAADAEVAVISVGEGNPYGHPHDEALDRLAEFVPHVYRTDRDGRVVVSTDGERIRVETAGAGD